MEEVIFLNGKFVKQEEAKLSVLGPGFLYGWGLFETMRAYNNKVVYLNEHLKRLKVSSKLIEIKLSYPLAKLKTLIKNAVKLSGANDAYIRLTLWKTAKGADILLVARSYQPYHQTKYRKGFSVCVSQFRQNENSFLAHLKTTNYLFYQLAYLEAKEKGDDEAVILNNSGYLCEGSRSNLFLIKNNTLFTPALECGCLDGITRKVVFALARKHKIKVTEGNFALQDLYQAEGAFLTNSLIGVMPLTSVEKHRLSNGAIHNLTKFFLQKYNALLKNGT